MDQTRAGVNVIIPTKLLQRAQILTWTLDVKSLFIRQHRITAIVNFWPKIDPDASNLRLDMYYQVSCPDSNMMLLPHININADAVCAYMGLPKKNVLVLCEAGKTRSVFFCVMLWQRLHNCTYEEAEKSVAQRIGSIDLKGFMKEWLAEEDSPKGLI